MVYVLSKDGKPLMPTNRHGKVKHLLKDKKAKVISKEPFTIQLLYDSDTYTQNLTLGVDTGSATIGTAVSDDTGNILYVSEVEIRNDITKKMKRRSEFRRLRRNRKTRYRKPRFLNRKNSKKLNRFSPTMTSKINSHKKEIEFIKSILPITTLVLETGKFDPHLMQNPDMNRHWGYQKGPNYGYENLRAMILDRDNYTCRCCKGKHKDSRLEVHHIIFRCNGGADVAENLITLCHTCHVDLHDERIKLNLKGKSKGTLKHATQMNSIRAQLLKHYSKAIETFGFVTKANRQELNLPKEHYMDAVVIATSGIRPNFKTNNIYYKKCISKGDYQKTKGVDRNITIPTGRVNGFRKCDKVKYKNNIYFIQGRYSTGYAILMNIKGEKQTFTNPKIPKMCNLQRISARKTTLIDRKVLNLNNYL